MAVDHMAKDAAHSVRTSEDVRSKLEAAWQNATHWRFGLGAATYDAQNFTDDPKTWQHFDAQML